MTASRKKRPKKAMFYSESADEKAWTKFAASALAQGRTVDQAGEVADAMIAELDKRRIEQ